MRVMAPPTVEERLRALEDERAILDRLYAYGHALDYGDRDAWIDSWLENAHLQWPETSYAGREAIAGAFDAHTHAPAVFHKHVLVEPRVTVDGDSALASSYFMRVDHSPSGPVVRSFGRYRDVLQRCEDGAWRFAERRTDLESRIALA
jgi:ketosteroid isomerase-like protein